MYLQVQHLIKEYDGIRVVDQVSFNVAKGKILCILGPSGCGKTTILNAIGGFLSDIQGRIILDFQDITHLAPEDRPVSTVFQSYGLFPHMNVLDNVKYGLHFNGTPRKQREPMAKDMLAMVGLQEHLKSKIHELSGGQRQRVALARSLVVKPKVLLLDEPLSNLDAKMRNVMREEIKAIQKEFEITTILVTHDQEEAFELADEIVLLNQGRVEQIAKAEKLYRNPANHFVADFIGEINRVGSAYIRPEKVLVNPDHGEGEQGRIETIIFRGETLELWIKVASGYLLKATVLNLEDYQLGQEVVVDYQSHLIEI